jgi:hypothetical protein
MKTTEGMRETVSGATGFAVDTTFVLLFLALEFGRSLVNFGFDGVLLGISLVMLIVLPYFYMSDGMRPDLAKWLAGRGTIATFAALLGIAFQQTLGVVIPDALRFLPMILLIVSAMASCYIQFYGFLRLRPAK